MAELQQNRYDQLIRRVGGIIGVGSMVSEAIGELFPMLELENTTPELLALSGWRTAWQSTERPAVGGQVSASQLFNPAGSGVLVSVTQVVASATNVSGFLNMEVTDTQLGGTPVRGLFRDGRFGGLRETTATTEHIDNVSVGGGPRIRFEAANIPFFLRDDNGIAVLPPGFGLSVGSSFVNTILTITYFWRERAAEPSELNF